MVLFRLETKKRMFLFGTCRFRCVPELDRSSSDQGHLSWLWWNLDWLSKDWLEFCEKHGGGLASTFDWLEENMKEDGGGSAS